MPYLGDSITNPVPLTLVAGAATGEASSAADHDRHVCWFSVPAQPAGNSLLIEPLQGGLPHNYDLCMVWEGADVAYFRNTNSLGEAVGGGVYWELPAGVDVRIGVLPRGSLGRPGVPDETLLGRPSGGMAKTLVQWEALFAPDLTRRLGANTSVSVTAGATVTVPGSVDDMLVMDFTTLQEAQTLDLSGWVRPEFAIVATVPAGYALRVFDDHGIPEVGCDEATASFDRRGSRYFIVPPDVEVYIYLMPESKLPAGTLTVQAVAVSDVSGTTTDTDGLTPEPCNVLLFDLRDAVLSDQSPSGAFSIPNVPAGNYILVAFSQEDARDIVSTNLLVPQGERVVGGIPPPPPPPDVAPV
jgi:hypothetical protein